MWSFAIGRKFSLILLAANAICHLLDAESLEACLRCVCAHLEPGGRFIVVVFVPDPAKLLPESTQREPFAEYEDPQRGGMVVVTYTYRYEFDTQIKRIELQARYPDSDAESISSIDMRMYFPQELDALLRHNGFNIVSKWGDHSGAAFDQTSAFQIVTCNLK
jgi:SAM-dependent methyltransferase